MHLVLALDSIRQYIFVFFIFQLQKVKIIQRQGNHTSIEHIFETNAAVHDIASILTKSEKGFSII